jgi:hypothetical protein
LDAADHVVLAFEGTDLPDAIILRSMSGDNGIFGAAISPICAGVGRFGSVAFSGFNINAPILQVLPVDVGLRTSKTNSGERNPRARGRSAGVGLAV